MQLLAHWLMLAFAMRSCSQNKIKLYPSMKNVLIAISCLFFANLSWGSEDLFSFFSDHELGSKVASEHEGYLELPGIKILGSQFSSSCDLDEEKKIRSVSLFLRKKQDEDPADIHELFNRILKSLTSQHGEAGSIEVPNFQDATERTGSLYAWKNKEAILVLQKIQSPGQIEIVIQMSRFDYFASNLGADTGSFLLPEIQAKSGELKIAESASSPTGPSANDLPVEKNRKVESGKSREPDLEGEGKPVQIDPTVQEGKNDGRSWTIILGAIAALGVAVILGRAFLRGRAF